MTWSILARDANGHLGVAIASRFFSVGSLCVHTRRGVGAIATQALMNPLYGQAGLDLLAQGRPADAVIAALVAGDDGREQRQVHVLPLHGPGAAHTGAECIDWCGHLLRDGFSVAGNMLAGARVIEATAEALLETALRRGLPAHRVEGPEELDGIDLGGATRIAFSAGGFASDGAVRAVAAALKTRRPQL